MIGIIGYGMVGKAVAEGFPEIEKRIYDPSIKTSKFKDVLDTEAVFVCVPTPTDDTEYSILTDTLKQLREADYKGTIVVKSTVPPKYIKEYNVVYNPEFLTRETATEDFIYPQFLVLGGDRIECSKIYKLYMEQSIVDPIKSYSTDIETAAMIKYTLNTFFATKVTFMNQMAEVAEEMGANFNQVVDVIKDHPWFGSNHFRVPGPDGQRGYGGPCLPKDTEAMVKEFDVEILKTVVELNSKYR